MEPERDDTANETSSLSSLGRSSADGRDHHATPTPPGRRSDGGLSRPPSLGRPSPLGSSGRLRLPDTMDRPLPLGRSTGSGSSGRSYSNLPPVPPVPSTPLGLSERPSLTRNLPPSAVDEKIRLALNPTTTTNSETNAEEMTDIRASLDFSDDRPPHPRTNWSVPDTSLRPVPAFYPPLDPNGTVFVYDASPSVVAARISECLRKRSVSVEYDDEAATASGITVDRVRFVVHLYRGSRSVARSSSPEQQPQQPPSSPGSAATTEKSKGQMTPDFSHGVIVECQRVRGDAMSYHRTSRAILHGALGDSDGLDDRRSVAGRIGTSPLGFGRSEEKTMDEDEESDSGRDVNVNPLPRSTLVRSSDSSSPVALLALEKSLGLLRKDRLGAQALGMESLVLLTDERSSGADTAMMASLTVLGAPITNPDGENDDEEPLLEVHTWILSLLKDRSVPGDDVGMSDSVTKNGSDYEMGSLLSRSNAENSSFRSGSQQQQSNPRDEDAVHVSTLRGLALRSFTNALEFVSGRRGHLLRSILQTHSEHLVSTAFLSSFMEDLAGASRPPSAVTWESGTRFGSAHDAALSAKCLRLLVEHSDDARDSVLNLASGGGDGKSVLMALEKARFVGQSTHAVLEREAGLAYGTLRAAFEGVH